MPGPRPKPTAQLKLTDSRIAKYNRPGEPEPELGVPAKPDWLSSAAGEVWDQTIKILSNMQVLTIADGAMLSRYCVLWADWRDANDWIQQHGTTYPLRNSDGGVRCFMQFPQVGIRNNAGRELRAIECEFGLSPSARTRINVDHSQGKKGSGGKSRFFSAG